MSSRIVVVGFVVAVFAACGDIGSDATDATTGDTSDERLPLEITFERSGGFAGIVRTTQFGSSDLTADQAAELRRLVDDAAFFDLPSVISADPVADDFTFEVTIVEGDREHTVTTPDSAAPDELRPLLGWLNQYVRSGG